MKEQVIMVISSTEEIKEFFDLDKIPNKQVLDLTVVFADGDGEIITDSEVSADELYNKALESAQGPWEYRLMPLNEKLSDLTGDDYESSPLIFAGNRSGVLGASIIAVPEMLEKAYQKIKSDFFVIPSSKHEVLLLPATYSSAVDKECIKGLVETVNSENVSEKDFLSNSVYRYDGKRKELVFA